MNVQLNDVFGLQDSLAPPTASKVPCLPCCSFSPAGGVLWLRQFHRGHGRQCIDAFPLQPGDRDDPRGLHDVSGRGLPNDDPALQAGFEHAAFRAAGMVLEVSWGGGEGVLGFFLGSSNRSFS